MRAEERPPTLNRVRVMARLAVLRLGLVVVVAACGGDRPQPATRQQESPDTAPAPVPPPDRPAAGHPDGGGSTTAIDERWGIVPLADGAQFQTTLYDLAVIGRLQTAQKQPYYVLAGRGCAGCDANLALYVHSPSDGPMGIEGEQPRFPYPGREVFYEDSTPLYEARAFFGDCAAAYPNAVLWFQRQVDVDGRWRATVRVAQVKNDSLSTTVLDTGGPSLGEVEAAVARGRCREIPGRDRASEP